MDTDNEGSPPVDGVTGSVLGPVLQVLNEIVDSGLLVEYAIGGAVGVLYYVEPVLTYDFDVVCHFPAPWGIRLRSAPPPGGNSQPNSRAYTVACSTMQQLTASVPMSLISF